MRSLEEIEKDLVSLIKERNEVLELGEQRFSEVYTVFNSVTGEIDDNTFVLNPNRKLDLEYIKKYAEDLVDCLLKRRLLEWVSEYQEHKCISGRVCKVTKTPVCCANCGYQSKCLEEGGSMCNLVSCGFVLDRKGCTEEVRSW